MLPMVISPFVGTPRSWGPKCPSMTCSFVNYICGLDIKCAAFTEYTHAVAMGVPSCDIRQLFLNYVFNIY